MGRLRTKLDKPATTLVNTAEGDDAIEYADKASTKPTKISDPSGLEAQRKPAGDGSQPVHSAFSKHEKRFIVFMVTMASFFSPLSGQIYYPIMPTLVQNYHLSNALVNLTISAYMILQGLAPSFMGTFADTGGRRPAYILAFTIYTAANIGLALQDSYAALMVLRCIQSAGSSGTVSFGYGVIADIATPAERGMFIGPMSAGVMIAPAVGPVLGGLLARFLGWRSVFWFLKKPKFPSSINPLKSFAILLEKDALIIISYVGLVMFSNIALLTTTPNLFGGLYGFNDLQIGLCFIPLGVSACIAAVLNGKVVDYNHARVARNLGFPVDRQKGDDLREFPIEKTRLQTVFPGMALGIAAFIPYGWVLERHSPLVAPLILQFIISFSFIASLNTLNTLLIDLFPDRPATAASACNLVRCWLGAIGAALIDHMLNGMGWGWCFAFLGLVMAAAMGLLWLESVYGMVWRERRLGRTQSKRESQAEMAESEDAKERKNEGVSAGGERSES